MSIEQALRKAVEKAIAGGDTRYAICKATGIGYTTLGRWLDEGRDIRVSTADALAAHFGLDLGPIQPSDLKAKPKSKRKQ